MFRNKRAVVMLLRDSHYDYTRIDLYTQLGEEGDIRRLIESRLRLTGIAGLRHMRLGVQVLRIIAGYVNLLCLPVVTRSWPSARLFNDEIVSIHMLLRVCGG